MRPRQHRPGGRRFWGVRHEDRDRLDDPFLTCSASGTAPKHETRATTPGTLRPGFKMPRPAKQRDAASGLRQSPNVHVLDRPDCHPPIAPSCLAIQPAKQGTSTRTLKGGRAVDHCHTRGRNEPQPPISRFSNSKRPRDQALTEMKLCRSVAALPALPWIGPILGSTRLWPLGSKLASRGFSVTGCPIRAMTSLSQKQASQGCPARGCLVLAEQPMRDSRS